MALLDRFAGLDRRFGLDRESEQRGSRTTVVVFLAMFSVVGLVPIGAALWNGHHDRDVASRLRRDGAVAAGEVIDVSQKGKLKAVAGQGAKVIFRTESGEEVSTWVKVRDVPRRGPTEVRYLRSDPSIARLVDDPAPRNGVRPVISAVLFAAAWIALVLASAMNFHRQKH